jgi:transcriptional regulator with XRE-family HTH domain
LLEQLTISVNKNDILGLALLAVLTYPSSLMTNPQEIGHRIRAARRERRLTQEALADAVGVSRSAVAQWETGRAGQLTPNLGRIAAALGIGVEFLMQGDVSRGTPEAMTGDELAMLRLYRECAPDDQQILLRTARRLARPPLKRAR